MFLDFEELTLNVGEQKIFVRHGGDPGNPSLLLLHGYPQTSAMWHAVAPQFTDQFHVICPDLRGYGRSSKPASDDQHTPYSKREMAKDMVSVMSQMGHETFLVGAHDRGARVTHRMALDHPQNVQAMVLLDIAPTREMYRDTSKEFASAYWHWFFLIQKHPIPEQIIGNDPAQFWKLKCFNQAKGESPFTAEALDEYIAAFSTPEAIHATCEDYRAAATIDIEHDDRDDGRKIEQPLMVLWAKRGVIETCFDAMALWQARAHWVEGEAVDATHYMAEEIPDEIASRMRAFFLRQTDQKDAAE
ncbi:alpha/beta fold hydrolase [Ruegeria arenilitoris]|uniref:alpha/beta fold hydrolase n=1 Tax=Ruegeria arenilitoris TaxID=1173585 RepID=UPI001CFD1802|nr:alpha/beta hydrolase [Ruegeria arenilitoris]